MRNERVVSANRKFRDAIFDRDGGHCVHCGITLHRDGRDDGDPARFVVDHLHPISLGGTSTMENCAASCRSCNGRKSGKTAEEWESYPKRHSPPKPTRRPGAPVKPALYADPSLPLKRIVAHLDTRQLERLDQLSATRFGGNRAIGFRAAITIGLSILEDRRTLGLDPHAALDTITGACSR